VHAPQGGFFFSAEPADLKFAIHGKIVFLRGTLPWGPTLRHTRKCCCVWVTVTSFKKCLNDKSTMSRGPLFYVYWNGILSAVEGQWGLHSHHRLHESGQWNILILNAIHFNKDLASMFRARLKDNQLNVP
jgi:hypothetical protein